MRWLGTSNLEQWADKIAARTELSELVRDLIRATAPTIGDFRFPVADSAEMAGYDGRLSATGVPPYVPDGDSLWEFGTSEKYVAKANEDYRSRTENPNKVDLSTTTIVLVTLRKWSSKSLQNWLAERRGERKWKDVRVLDGVALEEWLSQCPAVSARLSRKLGLMPQSGVQGVNEFWEEYATRFEPRLTEGVLLAGRDKQAEELVRQLTDRGFRHLWQADSPEEVIAFAVAAIRHADAKIGKFLEARTLVISTEESGRELAGRRELVFLPRLAAIKIASLLGQNSATIVPLGRDELKRHGATILNRPNSEELATAIKTMGLVEDRARRMASACGRSVTVLARLIPSGSAPKPEWDGNRRLLPALLTGGWDAGYVEDKNVLAALASTASYEAYKDELRPFLLMQDPALDREGDTFKVRAPLDAFLHLGHLIGRADLERLRDVAGKVFRERDPKLEIPVDERIYAGIRGQRLKHSEWLRSGVATSLLLISVFHRQARMSVSGLKPEPFVTELIAGLLESDWRSIASLGHELVTLMEAAPRPLLSALAHLLEGDGEAMRPIFQDREASIFGSSSPHTYVLWALEMLAWDPSYLSEVTLLLSKLAKADPGGNLMNRPLKSLREILLPWHPNTNASLGQRIAALDQIIAQEPAIGWKLVVELLPEFHGIASNNPRPRYREAEVSQAEVVTYALVAEGYNAVIHRALRLAGEDADRWVTIIENISFFRATDRVHAIELLETLAQRIEAPARMVIWSALTKLVNRHRTFHEADWSMEESDLARIDSVIELLKPADPMAQIKWLFDDYHPYVPGQVGTNRLDALERERSAAIRRLLSEGGVSSVLELADRAKLPHAVGISTSRVIDSLEDFTRFANSSVGKSERLLALAKVLSSVAHHRFGKAWEEYIRQKSDSAEWTIAETVELMMNWRGNRATWDFVESLGAEVRERYWENASPWVVDASIEDLEFMVKKYLEVGRALAGIEALHDKARHMSSELLFTLLDGLGTEIAASPDRLPQNFSYELGEILKVLRSRTEVPRIEIARREYTYLPLFGYEQPNLTIHTLIAEDPEIFMSILRDVFKSEVEEPREPTEERKARAQLGYRLLSRIHSSAGVHDGKINVAALRSWIVEVRRMAAEEHRLRIAEEYIGRFLAHTPFGSDGAWPDPEVASLIEEFASDKIDQGIQIEQFNLRGTTSRGVYEGGGQERALSAKVRRWAQMRQQYARTSRLLKGIAEEWEREAEREDVDARKDAMRFA